MLRTGWHEAMHKGDTMPFLVLDRNGQPLCDPDTALICHFDTRDEAEAYRKANKGDRVMMIPAWS